MSNWLLGAADSWLWLFGIVSAAIGGLIWIIARQVTEIGKLKGTIAHIDKDLARSLIDAAKAQKDKDEAIAVCNKEKDDQIAQHAKRHADEIDKLTKKIRHLEGPPKSLEDIARDLNG